ncbi:MAG: histone deacetylase [Pseudomonadota bacterium]
MALPLVYHPHYMAPLRDGHRFPMSKYGYLRDALIARGLLPETGGYLAPAPFDVRRIAAVHELAYVERAFNVALTPDEVRRIGLPSTERVVRRARLAAAGTALAGRLALEHGVACNMAGGSHHAGLESGAGFCVFNDVAVAAQALLDDGLVRRIMVVDCDVHQGDGTAEIFGGDAAVFTLSVHAEKNFPARKQTSDLDIPLPDGLRDAAYLEVLREMVAPVIAAQMPDLIFYNAGVDPYENDKLGRLNLTRDGLRARDRLILSTAVEQEIPIVGVLGGGYSNDPRELADRHAILFEEASAALGRKT